MTVITSLALVITGWARGVSSKRSPASIIAGLLWLWMWVLVWGNTENPDLDGYLYLYSSEQTAEGIGPGYWLLVRIARGAGLDYTAFLAVVTGGAFLILALVASWFTQRTSLVAVLYFIYPFAYDAIQSRNLIAMSLVMLGFALRSRLRRGGSLWFIALTLLAATLHLTMLVVLITLPVMGKHGKLFSQAVLVTSLLATAVGAIFPSAVGSAAQAFLRQWDIAGYDSYLDTRGSLGIVLYASLHVLSLFLMRRTLAVITLQADQERIEGASTVPDTGLKWATLTFRAGMVMTILLPLVAVNSNFFRLLRNLWFLYAISFSVGIDREARSSRSRGLIVLTTGLVAVHSITFILWGFDGVAAPLLENNRIIDSVRAQG